MDLVIKLLSGECPNCGFKKSNIKNRRMNTAYHDEASNWLLSCGTCFYISEENWAEMWKDYGR